MRIDIDKYISNSVWSNIFMELFGSKIDDEYNEKIGADFTFMPNFAHIMTNNSNLFDMRKAAAMYFWYKSGSQENKMILDYFDEYKHCIDDMHNDFNSNYGFYAYKLGYLDRCVKRLIEDKNTRQACFCINNNSAMGDTSIDKLCTNVIHFFIRENRLKCIIQMRSSNFITLLPYDVFMFSVFYRYVYGKLKEEYPTLRVGVIKMQIASLHFYKNDFLRLKPNETREHASAIIDFISSDWKRRLEDYLVTQL